MSAPFAAVMTGLWHVGWFPYGSDARLIENCGAVRRMLARGEPVCPGFYANVCRPASGPLGRLAKADLALKMLAPDAAPAARLAVRVLRAMARRDAAPDADWRPRCAPGLMKAWRRQAVAAIDMLGQHDRPGWRLAAAALRDGLAACAADAASDAPAVRA